MFACVATAYNYYLLCLCQAAWVHRYESCAEFLNKMDPEDNVSFIKHSVFSDKLIEMVSGPWNCRIKIDNFF